MLRHVLLAFLLLNTSAPVWAAPQTHPLVAQSQPSQSAEQIYTQANAKLKRFLKEEHSATQAVSLLEDMIADYNRLRETTQDAVWMNKMATDIRLLLAELQNKGLSLYQEAARSPQQKNRLENLHLAYQYLRMASQLSGPGYMLEQIQGQIAQTLGENPLALQHYRRSLDFYQQNPPTDVDPDVAYNYFRISTVQEIQQPKSLTDALHSIDAGLQFLEALKTQVSMNPSPPVMQRYQTVYDTLKSRQLDLYLRMPEQRLTGLKAYQKAIEEYPKDYFIYLGYGNLLEQAQQGDAAAAIYKQALKLSTENHLAHLSLGRLYYTRGAELLQKAHLNGEKQEAMRYEKQARMFYQEAIPYLETALKQPKNQIMVLQVLLQISAYLNDLEAYRKYKQQLDTQQSGAHS